MTVYRFSPWQSLVVFAFLASSSWLLPVQAADPIVPAGAKLEKLFDGIVLTEGVAVAPDGMVYFSDITFFTPGERRKRRNPGRPHLDVQSQNQQNQNLPLTERHVQRNQIRRERRHDHL